MGDLASKISYYTRSFLLQCMYSLALQLSNCDFEIIDMNDFKAIDGCFQLLLENF
jgi:hypothetical protein